MIKVALIGILIVGLLLVIWKLTSGDFPFPTGTKITQNQSDQPAKSQIANSIEVSLNTQNGSNELGLALLTEQNGKVLVHIEVKGEPAGASQPAHIHLGACPNPSVVKYPLTSVAKGVSDTTLDVTLDELKKELPLAINIHESASKMKSYLVCGDFKL